MLFADSIAFPTDSKIEDYFCSHAVAGECWLMAHVMKIYTKFSLCFALACISLMFSENETLEFVTSGGM